MMLFLIICTLVIIIGKVLCEDIDVKELLIVWFAVFVAITLIFIF